MKHEEILNILNELRLINYVSDWDISMPNNYICVTRYLNDNLFLLSETHRQMTPDDERVDRPNGTYWQNVPSYRESKLIFQRFLNMANRKNPLIKFRNLKIQYYGENLDREIVNENINEARKMMKII